MAWPPSALSRGAWLLRLHSCRAVSFQTEGDSNTPAARQRPAQYLTNRIKIPNQPLLPAPTAESTPPEAHLPACSPTGLLAIRTTKRESSQTATAVSSARPSGLPFPQPGRGSGPFHYRRPALPLAPFSRFTCKRYPTRPMSAK